MKLSLYSEKVAPTGNVTSKGIINQLGRPNLDMLAVLVRETVQNSWDARASDQEPVRFSVAGWILNQTQQKFLRESLFAEYPLFTSLPLAESLLSSNPVNVLAISDRGTKGMGGPTRADIVTRSNEPRDFVDFLRDVGQPSDKELTGGTYGYGKAALYRASRVRTICVYTRCKEKGRLETRFIAAALGEPYSKGQNRYTGRHWWGRLEDNIVEPLLDADADSAAEALGLPKFRGNECGTTILVFQPILNEKEDQQAALDGDSNRTPLQTINLMAEYILWYFWPKMLAHDGRRPAVVFDLSWQGEQVHLPHPVEFPPLQGYVLAMCRVKDSQFDPNSAFRFLIEDIASQRPKQHLGRLALQQFPAASAKYFDTGDSDSPFSGLIHHTALMRQPELVVKYLPGSAAVNEKIGYAGVFITDAEVDAVFANSEPPTHDDWISQSLEDSWHKRYVNAALREIGKKMDTFAKPPAVRTDSRDLMPLGAFATRLGSSLMPAEQGPAATFKPFTVRPAVQTRPNQNGQIKNSPESDLPKPLPDGPVSSPSNGHDSAGGVFPGIEMPAPGQLKEESSDSSSDTPMPSSGTNESTHPTYLYEPPKYEPQPTAASHKPKPIIGQARVKHIGDSHVLMDGVPALQFEFSVAHARNSSGTTVQAEARAVLNGSQMENDPPVGGSAARVMYWISPDGMTYAGSDEIFIVPEPPGNWRVIISLPDDMMLGVQFKAEARSAE